MEINGGLNGNIIDTWGIDKIAMFDSRIVFPYKAKPGFIAIFMTHDVIPDKNLWKKSDQIVISAEIWNVEDMVKTSLNDYTSIRVKDPEEIVAKHGSL